MSYYRSTAWFIYYNISKIRKRMKLISRASIIVEILWDNCTIQKNLQPHLQQILAWCWSIVYDAGPASSQDWPCVPCSKILEPVLTSELSVCPGLTDHWLFVSRTSDASTAVNIRDFDFDVRSIGTGTSGGFPTSTSHHPPILAQCWANGADAYPTQSQICVIILCLCGLIAPPSKRRLPNRA